MGDDDTLRACTDVLLRSPDKLEEWLSLADRYMQSYAENPKGFILPRAHELVKPLIDAYSSDLGGFVQYLIALRDRFDRSSGAFKDVQTVYRRVNGRFIQQARRERINRAVTKAEDLYGRIPYTKRMQWMANLEHEWAKRRVDFLDANRLGYENERLPAEDRVELLAEFWEQIDHEIYEGKIPPWN